MAVEKFYWTLGRPSISGWRCPTCEKGKLTLDVESLEKRDTANARETKEHPGWDPTWIDERFVGFLNCNYPGCKEAASISGTIQYSSYYYSGEDGEPEEGFSEIYIPNYISPAPNMFVLPTNLPVDISQAFRDGFLVYWTDRDACLNKWRIAVEGLLTSRGVSRFQRREKGKSLKPITLHRRIELFRQKNQEAADCLEAVKWLGNHASHFGSAVKEDDVWVVADILEHALEVIYVKTTSPLALAKKINRQRGPVKSKAR